MDYWRKLTENGSGTAKNDQEMPVSRRLKIAGISISPEIFYQEMLNGIHDC